MKVFALILILLPTFLFAQQELGAKLDYGASIISNQPNQGYEANVDMVVKPGPSTNFGLFYNWHISKKSMLAVEMTYMRIESREVLNGVIMLDQWGRFTAYGNQKVKKRISSLSLPIYYGFKFERWSVNVGVQFSTVLSGSAEVQSESEFYNYEMKYDLPLNVLDYGPRIGLTWQLVNRFNLEATYYHGLNNINAKKDIPDAHIWNVQQLLFGIKYAFYQSKEERIPLE